MFFLDLSYLQIYRLKLLKTFQIDLKKRSKTCRKFRNCSAHRLQPGMNGGVGMVNPLEVWAKAKEGATHNEGEEPFEKYNCEARGEGGKGGRVEGGNEGDAPSN